ncbi:hydrolase 1, exosortase A system-associated [Massilia sp. X63]|uniref:hydrolase 1, exosortase A system-associated n=1 Tax=Massilia sp. X63 TaxID=3237285 RepID=UPI0034DD5CFD
MPLDAPPSGSMPYEEKALAFPCGDAWLVGVATLPGRPAARGVLVVVGGPQYRAGSHRQFTLLARALAEQGIPAMRFDVSGMGDSGGAARGFAHQEADIRAAIDAFMACAPGLREVVLWGLCDGASSAAMVAADDARVAGLVLLNPWVRTEESLAKATLKHYYRERLLAPDLWKKILRGRFELRAALASLLEQVRRALRPPAPAPDTAGAACGGSLPERMHDGLARFGGPVLLVLSGADLTAREFADLAAASPQWRQLLAAPRFTRHELAPADHTFSRRAWRDQVAAWTTDWVRSW